MPHEAYRGYICGINSEEVGGWIKLNTDETWPTNSPGSIKGHYLLYPLYNPLNPNSGSIPMTYRGPIKGPSYSPESTVVRLGSDPPKMEINMEQTWKIKWTWDHTVDYCLGL